MNDIISVPGSALFDVLREQKATFYFHYRDYFISIYTLNKFIYPPDIDDGGIIEILITKDSFMNLLLNRVFSCDDYTLKVEL